MIQYGLVEGNYEVLKIPCSEAFGLPSGEASGNIAKLMGAKPIRREEGYRGSYEELFDKYIYLNSSKKLSIMTTDKVPSAKLRRVPSM